MSGTMNPPPGGPGASPSLLPPHPKRGPGVRRLNRVPVLIGAGLVGVASIGVGYTFYQRNAANAARQVAETPKGEAGKPAILNGAPEDGVILPVGLGRSVGPSPAPQGAPAAAPLPSLPSDASATGEDDATKARRQAWQVYYQQLAEVQKQRHDAATQALHADTSGSSPSSGGTGAEANPQLAGITPSLGTASGQEGTQGIGGSGVPGYPPGAVPGAPAGGFGTPYASGYGYGYAPPPAVPDATGAREKRAFIAQAGTGSADNTVLATVRDPVSPYLITAGDVIPCVMQGGADSDTPGQMVGRVSADVYDSATGRFLLIPHGSKVVGTYDNAVTTGQARLPAVIARVIFPDSSSINIGGMPAADQAGFAGLHDQVDRHLWEKFGNAVIVAVAGAGVQLSQPQSSGRDGYTSQQLVAGSLGQQFGELGQEVARSGLTIPNTLRIRPGYAFTVQLTKDVVLRPYVDGRTAARPVSLGPIVQ